MRPIRITLAPATASATAISASASPGAGAIVLTALAAGPIDPQAGFVTATTLGLGRIITLVSGGNDSGITFTITGKDENGIAITEGVTGGNIATVPSTLFYTSVSSITHTGSVAGTFSAGIRGTTLSAQLGLLPLNFYGRTATLMEVGISGTINYTVKWTADDIVGGTIALNNAALFATPGVAPGTALTGLAASNYDRIPPGGSGVSIRVVTYSTGAKLLVNIISPSNSTSN